MELSIKLEVIINYYTNFYKYYNSALRNKTVSKYLSLKLFLGSILVPYRFLNIIKF